MLCMELLQLIAPTFNMYLDRDFRVIQIQCQNLHRRNPLRRTFCHFHNRETYPYSSKDNFDRCPVIYSQITIVLPCQNQCRVYNRSGTQHGILYRTYGQGIGNDFHSLSIFCRGRALSLYSISHLVTHARTLFFDCSILNYFKILLRYVLIEKLIKRLHLSLQILMLNM